MFCYIGKIPTSGRVARVNTAQHSETPSFNLKKQNGLCLPNGHGHVFLRSFGLEEGFRGRRGLYEVPWWEGFCIEIHEMSRVRLR